MKQRFLTLCVLGFTFYASLLLPSGCGKMLGVLVSKTVGEDIPARYVPEKKDPMLVLAENYQSPGSNSAQSEQLARYVCQALEKKKVAPLIDPTAAIDLRSQDPAAFRKMSITQIGQKLGAGQVLYIAVLSDTIEMAQGSEFQRGQAAARVRIVDVQTGQSRWPTDASSGYPVSAQTPVVKIADESSAATLSQALQARLGGDIARLFYKYKADEEGDTALGQ